MVFICSQGLLSETMKDFCANLMNLKLLQHFIKFIKSFFHLSY